MSALWNFLFPPRLSERAVSDLKESAAATQAAAKKVSDKFERISNTAAVTGKDPLAILIHEVKGASFRRQIEEESN